MWGGSVHPLRFWVSLLAIDPVNFVNFTNGLELVFALVALAVTITGLCLWPRQNLFGRAASIFSGVLLASFTVYLFMPRPR